MGFHLCFSSKPVFGFGIEIFSFSSEEPQKKKSRCIPIAYGICQYEDDK